VCCSVLQCVAVCCSVLQCVAVCCSVLQCVAVCCSVLQCIAARSMCWNITSNTPTTQVRDSFVCVRRPVHTWHDPFICISCDSFTCAVLFSRGLRNRNVTHAYVWHDSLVCDLTDVWREWFIMMMCVAVWLESCVMWRVTWLVGVWLDSRAQVSRVHAECGLFYRALLQKRPIT